MSLDHLVINLFDVLPVTSNAPHSAGSGVRDIPHWPLDHARPQEGVIDITAVFPERREVAAKELCELVEVIGAPRSSTEPTRRGGCKIPVR